MKTLYAAGIVYEPVFCNRGGTFQIAQATIGGKYVYTHWAFFPVSCFKEPSFQHRFIANNLPSADAVRVFGGLPDVTIEELPYTEGYSFPIFKSDESAMAFLESSLFTETFKDHEGE